MMLRLNKRFPSWLIVIGKGSIADSCYSNLPWFYLFFFFIFLCQWDFIKKSQVVWSSLHSFTGECPSFPAFCLWHGHCTVADWLKDTLIRSLSIWHVFSKESSLFFFFAREWKKGPAPFFTYYTLCPCCTLPWQSAEGWCVRWLLPPPADLPRIDGTS